MPVHILAKGHSRPSIDPPDGAGLRSANRLLPITLPIHPAGTEPVQSVAFDPAPGVAERSTKGIQPTVRLKGEASVLHRLWH